MLQELSGSFPAPNTHSKMIEIAEGYHHRCPTDKKTFQLGGTSFLRPEDGSIWIRHILKIIIL